MSEPSLPSTDFSLTADAIPVEALQSAWRAWQPGQPPPRWQDFLAPERQPEQVFSLIQLDIECRVQAGLPALLVERYFLHVRLGDERQLNLIRWEYQQRWKCGQRPLRAAYRSAFPQHAAALAELRPRWNCPTCRQQAIGQEDEAGETLHCPQCDSVFAHAEVFPRPGQGLPAGSPAGLDLRNYQLHEQLGAGGMGEVYRGRDPALGRDLAVKVIRPALRDHPAAECRFLREARVTGTLQHPGIVPVHNLGRLPDGRLYFTMKLVRGRTLQRILAEGTDRLPELLAIFEKVCQAVAYAHSKGVLHRDLKPSNIMVGSFGEVQVMDWGLAKVLSERRRAPGTDAGSSPPVEALDPGSPVETTSVGGKTEGGGDTVAWAKEPDDVSELSRAGRAMGTPGYMAPEQSAGLLEQVDERADVFSLGAILCVLLIGRQPDTPCPATVVLPQAQPGNLDEAQIRLGACGGDAELLQLCRECLAVPREHRPRDAGVVAERLAAYQAGVQERLRRAELEQAQARVRALERRKRRRLAVALAAAVLLILAGGSAGLWWRQQRQAETDQGVTQALAEARLLQQQALANPADPARFREALAAARACSSRADAGASAHLRHEADHLVALLVEEEQLVRNDRRLLARLLDMRLGPEGGRDEQVSAGRMIRRLERTPDQQFARAFREWGLDVDATATEEAAARLRGRPSIVMEVVAALDEWAGERRRQRMGARQVQRLADLAKALEAPGSKQRELREVLNRGRLPLARALGVLSAALRPVPLPVPLALEEGLQLRRLAARTDPAGEPLLGLLTLAQALRQAGDEGRAEQLLRAALRVRPQEVVLHQALGRLLADQRRWRDAVECFTAARALRGDLGVSLAEALLRCGRDAEGQALFSRLARERPDSPFVHFRRGYALAEKGDPQGALAAFDEALRLDPTDALGHYNRGVALMRLQKEQSIAAFREALRLDPRLTPARLNLGILLLGKGMAVEAVGEFRQALRINPRSAEAHFNLGLVLRSQKNEPEAVRHLRAAIRLDPRTASAHFHLALSLEQMGKVQEAIREYRQAIALDDRNAFAHGHLGALLKARGEVDEAIEEYRRAIALDERFVRPYFSLGFALQARGDLEEAGAVFRRTIHLTPRDARAHAMLGEVLQWQGRCAEARPSLRRALDLFPEGHVLRPLVSRVLEQCDRLLALEKHLSAILEGRKPLPDAQDTYLLARMCQQRGKDRAAVQLYADAFARGPSLTADLRQGYRFCAARSAARAAGKADDAALRRRALGWLRGELKAFAELARQSGPARRRHVAECLGRWQQTPDLVPVRDPEALDRLDAEECREWRRLWQEVERLRREVAGKK